MAGDAGSHADYAEEARALRRRYAASLAVIVAALGALFLISEVADRHRDAYRDVEARIGAEIVAIGAVARLAQQLEGSVARRERIRAAIADQVARIEAVSICRPDGAGGWAATGALDETFPDPGDANAPPCARLAQFAADARLIAEAAPEQAEALRRIADAFPTLEARLVKIDDLRSAEGALWDDRHSLIWRASLGLTVLILLLQGRFVFARGLARMERAHTRLDEAAGGLMRANAELAEARNDLAEALEASEQARADVVAARRAEAAANGLKAEFLARLSHEVRTPLNALLGFAALMDAEPRDEKDRARLAAMREAGARLMAHFDDMIELSRLSAGEFRADPELFEPQALAQGQLDALAESAAARGVSLSLEIAPEARDRFIGDARRIGRAVGALLHNAVRHGGGAVRLEVSVWPGAGLRFSVCDQGPGVPDALREAIFAPFSQSDGSATRKAGGLGIGLSLARETARALGGALGMEDAPGGGAEFRLDVPALRMAARAA
ncbi:MAG: HAMP domain-containing sensor histidine kinase [Rubrimonas sp.]|uniref:sensor histidine kinase n=1 Tax=Rubrimonas sp. TaxID=2036015 RepID=UPI002FDEF34B